MHHLDPIYTNKSIIIDYLNKTFDLRQILRANKKSSTEIVNEFPRLIDFSGDMVRMKNEIFI